MKFKLMITSIIIALAVVVTVGISAFSYDCVETNNEAISIAKDYVYNKYGEEFTDYEISTYLEDGTWTVSYSLINNNNEIDILGGGGLELKINQTTGKVSSCLLQK